MKRFILRDCCKTPICGVLSSFACAASTTQDASALTRRSLASGHFATVSLISLICVLTAGCSFFHHRKVAPAPVRVVAVRPVVANGKVIQPQRLKRGGTLVIVPFSAGEGVAASAELDRVALMIVKGAADALQGDNRLFTVVFADQAANSDLAVQGHITAQKKFRVLRKWRWQDIGRELSVEGKVIDVKTQEPVASFSHTIISRVPEKSFADLADTIGQDIVQFLLNSAR